MVLRTSQQPETGGRVGIIKIILGIVLSGNCCSAARTEIAGQI